VPALKNGGSRLGPSPTSTVGTLFYSVCGALAAAGLIYLLQHLYIDWH
jgi:hypothetical protein